MELPLLGTSHPRAPRCYGPLLSTRIVAFALVLGIVCVPTASTLAQETNQAITLGHEGKQAFEAGRYAAAEEAFAKADAHTHSPVFVLFLARSQRAQGKLLEAKKTYDRLSAEPLDDDTPEAWRAAVEEGRNDRATLAKAIPTLTVVVRGSGVVTVNGVPNTGQPLELDPGTHVVTGTPEAGGEVVEEKVALVQGEHREITIDLTSAPKKPSTPPQRPPAAPKEESSSSLTVAGATLLGVGGLGHVLSIVSGLIALDRAADARAVCGTRGECAADVDGHFDASLTASYVSTTGLVAGSALAVVGTVLLLWPSDDASIAVGLDGVRLDVRF